MSLRFSCSQKQDLSPTDQEDHQAQFYEHYRKVAVEYDKEFLKKYDEDLNTTLIFVSGVYMKLWCTSTERKNRLDCFPLLPPHLLPRSTLSFSQTRATRLSPSSASLSIRSITPHSETMFPLFHNGTALHALWFTYRQSCLRVSPSRSSPPSLRCSASNG